MAIPLQIRRRPRRQNEHNGPHKRHALTGYRYASGPKPEISPNAVQFVNSGPAMIAFFMRFVRRYFQPPDASLRLMCNLFADHEAKQREIEDFWLATAGLPRSSLTKSIVNEYSRTSRRTRINTLPYGTCRLTFHSTRAVQHIWGAIQEYGRFERSEWLD